MRYFRKFGVEFEFSTPLNEMRNILKYEIPKVYGPNSLIIKKSDLSSINNKQWHLKKDRSTECELTTPISKPSDIPKIKSVLNKISKHDIKITKYDSMHIHIEAEDIPFRNLIAAWLQIEPTIVKCYPKTRQTNKYYCERLANKKPPQGRIANFFEKAEDIALDHSSSMSLFHYSKRKTAEFRLGEGSCDATIMENFVKFYMLFCNYASEIDPIEIVCSKDITCYDIEDIFCVLKIPYMGMKNFFRERYMEYC